MRRVLRHAGIGVQEMADYLDVDRSTVSTWINDRIEPSTQTLRLWSMRTGVPLEWLRHGDEPDPSASDLATDGYPFTNVVQLRADMARPEVTAA